MSFLFSKRPCSKTVRKTQEKANVRLLATHIHIWIHTSQQHTQTLIIVINYSSDLIELPITHHSFWSTSLRIKPGLCFSHVPWQLFGICFCQTHPCFPTANEESVRALSAVVFLSRRIPSAPYYHGLCDRSWCYSSQRISHGMSRSLSRSAGGFCHSLTLPGNSKCNRDTVDCLWEGNWNAEGKNGQFGFFVCMIWFCFW